jgi:hypothetical protein
LAADRRLAGDGMYTFVPAPFPISELDPGGDGPARTSIEGSVVRGHFERGGEAIADGAVAEVRRVVHVRELDAAADHPTDTELTYLCFGRPGCMRTVCEQIVRRPPRNSHPACAGFHRTQP